MSTPTSGDLFLVNRNGVNYQLDYDLMSTLQDTDLLLVNRAGVNYQIAASDINLGPDGLILPPVEVLTPVNGAGLNEGDPYTPMSSAYVSTDTSDVYYRHFPVTITTVSGGSWVNENLGFDGQTTNYAELTGAAGVVSQMYFTPQASWPAEYTSTVYAYAAGGGTVEVLDENLAVLRTYQLPTTAGNSVGVGIIRPNNRIQFTTQSQNTTLYFSGIDGATDYVINGRVAFQFADSTDLDNMVAPIIMTDENGDIKVPTTSTVDSITPLPGEHKDARRNFSGNGYSVTFDQNSASPPPVGSRMLWVATDQGVNPIITDNVALTGKYLSTSSYSVAATTDKLELQETQTVLTGANPFWNPTSVPTQHTEIGVAPKILDIVAYSGNGLDNRAIPHNLGTQPGMIIIKAIDGTYGWIVWHAQLEEYNFLQLDTNGGAGTDATCFPIEHDSENFYVGTANSVNNSSYNYVAYIFAHETTGKVKCGRYTSNGQTETVDLGFNPGFVLIKSTTGSNWIAKNSAMVGNQYWQPNVSLSWVGSATSTIDMVSVPGSFQADGAANSINTTYVYLAIAEDVTGPGSTQLNLLSGQDLEYFPAGSTVTTNAVAGVGIDRVFETTNYTADGSDNHSVVVQGSFYDMRPSSGDKWLMWCKSRTGPYDWAILDSLRHINSVLETNTNKPSESSSGPFMLNDPYLDNYGFRLSSSTILNQNNNSYRGYHFIARPQFLDIQKHVSEPGDSGATINHDLGAMPGFIMWKNTETTSSWYIWHSSLAADTYLQMTNAGVSSASAGNVFSNITDSSFDVGSVPFVTGESIAYIFADDAPGLIKCGSYEGSASDQTFDLGFDLKMFMIKPLGSGDWLVFDTRTTPGQCLRLNHSDSQVSRDAYFETNGFRAGGAEAGVSEVGQTYIYIAIADGGLAPSYPSSATVQETPDPNTATMIVNSDTFTTGDTASGDPLNASITSVGGSEGNTLYVDASTGDWLPGLYAKGTEITVDAPSPAEIVFTSMNQDTTPFSGIDATLSSRTWTLESGPSATGPWTLVSTYQDFDALVSQDGATPWNTTKPTLADDTFYRVKVQYDSTNAESVESVYHTFKTSA